MIELRDAPPDLLHRFVPTPFKLIAGDTVLETNDRDLLEVIDGHALAAEARNFTLRIVRDTCTDDSTAQHAFEAGALRLVTIGSRTVFAVDREQRLLYAFLSSNLPASCVPGLLRVALSGSENPRPLEHAACGK